MGFSNADDAREPVSGSLSYSPFRRASLGRFRGIPSGQSRGNTLGRLQRAVLVRALHVRESSLGGRRGLLTPGLESRFPETFPRADFGEIPRVKSGGTPRVDSKEAGLRARLREIVIWVDFGKTLGWVDFGTIEQLDGSVSVETQWVGYVRSLRRLRSR